MTLLVQLLFQAAVCPSLPPSGSPQSHPFWSFVCIWSAFVPGKGPFSPWTGCSFRARLGREELLAAAGGQLSWQRPPAASPARLAAVKAHPMLSLPPSLSPSLQWVNGDLRKTFQADLPRVLWPAWEPSTPRPPSACPISKGGFLVVTPWW